MPLAKAWDGAGSRYYNNFFRTNINVYLVIISFARRIYRYF
jgi:hypothetical protein